MHPTVQAVTARIVARSAERRAAYLARCARMAEAGPARAHLSCGNMAHVTAASGTDKPAIARARGGNIAIVTAYNDMLSAHQPFERFPAILKAAARAAGGTAQVAGGVPAMCDGVTQGRAGMELSLFSRDVIALAAGVSLSHDCYDAAIFLGVCDKIVPGLVIAAASFGHLPAVFAPAGPMTSGLPNDEKARIRQRHAAGEIGRDELLRAEMASYHGPGTCTFYGTANTNQMLMEVMGLQLPGASFVNPGTPLREALTAEAARRALALAATGARYTPASAVLSEKAFVNGMVGLSATGGSTNLVLHLVAMARAAGVLIDWQDMAELSAATPLMARVYPNGLADVNQFHAAGGLGFMIGELLGAGLLHEDVETVAGPGLARYTEEPVLDGADLAWRPGAGASGNADILRPAAAPFQPTGGLALLEGNLGRAVIKISAVKPEHHRIEAPVRIFETQESVKAAFRAGELDRDVVVVVRFQGPQANGMPELHALTPPLSVLQDRGHRVALVTDGRMSGASGKVPAAIHLSPEAADGGALARLRDGDVLRLDAGAGRLEVLLDAAELAARTPATADLAASHEGIGRELFGAFRAAVSSAETGAAVVI
ncbi:phosphogluconate dehydratase [Paralimibaculum aggregatum]|uniref:Phosphogluconate dehydratase n=1 Tax=Paralimibaculum aggregatum TaxID=3036245 RepID=A0ABQ6LU80_9RHOB|nr:phosphogluconate dehydratase [Limibaculum sp. NKW23]GMG85637.1 phosphogluconate dehydratase [Limibaculum sp. NKW23]